MPFHAISPGAVLGTPLGIEHVVIPLGPLLAADRTSNVIGTTFPATNTTIETAVHMRSVVQRNDDEHNRFITQREALQVNVGPYTEGNNTTHLPWQTATFGTLDHRLSDGPSRLTTDTISLTASGQFTYSGDAFSASDVPSTRDHYTTYDVSASDVPSTKDHYTTHDISQGRTVPPASNLGQQAGGAPSPTDSVRPSSEKAPRQYSEITTVDRAATIVVQVVLSPPQILSGTVADPTLTDLPIRTTKGQDERPGTTHERPWVTTAEAAAASEDIVSRFISVSLPMLTRTCERPATSERGESTA